MTVLLRRRSVCDVPIPPSPDIVVERARREALTVGTDKPDATNTGCLQDRATLPNTVNGNVVMTTPGQILEDTIVNGYVDMKAANQIVRNCWVRGPSGTITVERGLINTLWAGNSNALIEDCHCQPQVPSQNSNGVTGYEMTVKRVRVTNGSDGFGLFNSLTPNTPLNAYLYGCWTESLSKWYPDAAGRSANGSHNDAIQIQGGTGTDNIILRGNRFGGYIAQDGSGNTGGVDVSNSGTPLAPESRVSNAGIQLNQNVGSLSGLRIEDNWIGGGSIGLNGLAITNAVNLGVIKRNKFTHDQYFPAGHASNSNTTVTIRIATQCTIDCPTSGADANVYEDNGVAVVVVRG